MGIPHFGRPDPGPAYRTLTAAMQRAEDEKDDLAGALQELLQTIRTAREQALSILGEVTDREITTALGFTERGLGDAASDIRGALRELGIIEQRDAA